MFNWASLDIIYYPVSGIMWLWYKLFALLLGPTNFFAWALSVVFLVFSLRALLYKPFVRQIRTTRQMQELQPQIKALQKKYGKDRQRMALEMQKLQKEHGFNPILGCLPMLAQIPVFIGLFHVLRSFNRTGGFGIGAQHLPVDVNRSLPNYFFSAQDVGNFLDANLFGAPLGAWMTQSTGLEAFTQFGHFSRTALIAVGVPVMIAAGVATYFNSRASISRQSPEAAANPQTAIMNKLALYVFPLGVVVGGPFLPLAIILYWFANNVWTFGQQHYVFGKIEQEEEAKKQEAIERRSANAPAPGAKPAKRKKSATAGAANAATTVTEDGADTEAATETQADAAATESPAPQKQDPEKQPAQKQTPKAAAKGGQAKGGQAKAGGTANRNPRPGAKPKKRKR